MPLSKYFCVWLVCCLRPDSNILPLPPPIHRRARSSTVQFFVNFHFHNFVSSFFLPTSSFKHRSNFYDYFFIFFQFFNFSFFHLKFNGEFLQAQFKVFCHFFLLYFSTSFPSFKNNKVAGGMGSGGKRLRLSVKYPFFWMYRTTTTIYFDLRNVNACKILTGKIFFPVCTDFVEFYFVVLSAFANR